jgi:hypothetical protein
MLSKTLNMQIVIPPFGKIEKAKKVKKEERVKTPRVAQKGEEKVTSIPDLHFLRDSQGLPLQGQENAFALGTIWDSATIRIAKRACTFAVSALQMIIRSRVVLRRSESQQNMQLLLTINMTVLL